jgi:hypothetical protein
LFSFSFDYGQHRAMINMAALLLARKKTVIALCGQLATLMARWQFLVSAVITARARDDYGGVERFQGRRAGVTDYQQLWHVLK